MNCDAQLLAGMQRAATITSAAEREVMLVNEFFQLVQDSVSKAVQCEASFLFRITDGALSVVDVQTDSDGNQSTIGQLDFQPGAKQFLYSDFRGGPSYPLPPTLASIPILVTYIGFSLHFFRWQTPSPYFQGLSTTVHPYRDFLSTLGP